MIHITPDELSELRNCVGSLELVLARLDCLGAGIAAIHVDAAIDQLRNNIDVAAPDALFAGSADLVCRHELCGPEPFAAKKLM